jgi:hypothetical protein
VIRMTSWGNSERDGTKVLSAVEWHGGSSTVEEMEADII